jgi:hypothetical protein
MSRHVTVGAAVAPAVALAFALPVVPATFAIAASPHGQRRCGRWPLPTSLPQHDLIL